MERPARWRTYCLMNFTASEFRSLATSESGRSQPSSWRRPRSLKISGGFVVIEGEHAMTCNSGTATASARGRTEAVVLRLRRAGEVHRAQAVRLWIVAESYRRCSHL